MPSSRHVLITVTVCTLIVIFPHANGFNESRIVLHVLFLALLHAVHLFLSCNSYTGYPLRLEFSINCAVWCIGSSTELHRHILPNFANHVLTLAFDQLLAVISSFHVPVATFSVAAPSAWNQLPANIRNCSALATFLTKLKAHLFTVSFSH